MPNMDEIDDTIFELLDTPSNIEHHDDNMCIQCNTDIHFVENVSEGTIVCTACGTVHSEILDDTAEWRNFEDSSKTSVVRCSKSTNNGYSNTIGTSIACSNGSRLGVLHRWSLAQYKETTLNEVLELIKNKCRAGSILKCIEDDAKILYKNISDVKIDKGIKTGKKVIIRGKNRTSLIAACIYYACKRKECTRSPKEIAALFLLKDTDITKGCKTFLKLKNKIGIQCNLNPSTPEHFITRFCKDLHIDEYIDDTIKVVKNIQKLHVGSVHTPLSIATASILLISNYYKLNITKKIIASKFPVSEVTINKAYNEILSYKYILLDDDLTNKIVVLMDNIKKHIKIPQQLEDRYKEVTGKIILQLAKTGQFEYSVDSVDLINKLNRLSFKLYKKIYATNSSYYALINSLNNK